MPIEFRCTLCNKLLRIGDEMADRRVLCPECGTVLSVPADAVAAPEESLPPAESPPPTDQPQGSPFAPAQPGPTWQGDQQQQPYQAPPTAPQIGGVHTSYARRHVDNYLVPAILCLLFCCQPFGIVAIIYAAQVNGHLASGNYHAAISASNSARMWCWVSFWLALVPAILAFLLFVCAGLAGA